MIKAKQAFFLASNFKGYGFHGDKATIFYLTSEHYWLSVLSGKLYFLEIGPVHQTLWPFKCMMLKTLNSNFSRLRRHLQTKRLCEGWLLDLKLLCFPLIIDEFYHLWEQGFNWCVLPSRKNNKRPKKPVNRFLQDGVSAGIQSLQTSIVIILC